MGMQEGATFGPALRQAISSAGYSQAKLARELDIDAGQVSRWVHEKATPHYETVTRIEEILDVDLQPVLAATVTGYELYIAAPITGLGSRRMRTHQASVGEVVRSLEKQVNSYYWPGRDIGGPQDFEAPDLATERNLNALAHSKALLYVQFAEITRPSSALVELGIALGRRMKTTIVIRSDLHQPFMLGGFGGVAASLPFLPKARVYAVDSVDEACDLVDRNGRELLGLS